MIITVIAFSEDTMKKLLFQIFIAAIIFLPVSSLCQQKDSVFLFNGQILIGDIKRVELGILTIDDIDLKLQSIKLYKIKRLKTAQQFRIETHDMQVYFGVLGEDSKLGYTDILLADGRKNPIPITDISEMVFLGKSFTRRLDGNVGAGFSYSKSSSIGQFNLNSSVAYVTKNLENILQLSALYSLDSGKFSRDNENLRLLSYYNIDAKWIATGYVSYQRNLELSLARRFQEMFGGGNKVISREHLEVIAISGIALNQEKSTEKEKSGVLYEIPVIFRLNFYKFRNPNIQLGTVQSIFFSLSEKGRVRYEGNTNFSWELVKDFSFTVNLYNNFDSKPPPGSLSKFDYGIVMGLSYKF